MPYRILKKYSKNTPRSIFGVYFEYFSPQIENPKGAAAEGRRPLWGAAEGRPSILGEKYSKNTQKILWRLFFDYFLTILYGMGPPREYFLSIFGVFFEEPWKITK